jgi:hypothetical protein
MRVINLEDHLKFQRIFSFNYWSISMNKPILYVVQFEMYILVQHVDSDNYDVIPQVLFTDTKTGNVMLCQNNALHFVLFHIFMRRVDKWIIFIVELIFNLFFQKLNSFF